MPLLGTGGGCRGYHPKHLYIMKTKNILFVLVCTLLSVHVKAVNGDTFTANTSEGVTMTFKIISEGNNTVQVGNGLSEAISTSTSGTITIPSTVTKSEKNYTVISIGYRAFDCCSNLTSVTIPSSVITIGEQAFHGCSGLTSLAIPNSVTCIGVEAFWQCSGLISVTIPNSVTTIGESAFADCSGLTSLVIPNSVTSIGKATFERCSSLTSVTIPNSVTSIGENAFDGTAWYNNQPDGLIYINKVAYEYKGTMPTNTTIEIKDGTISISSYAFFNCSGLTSVAIPSSVTSIGDHAFSGCKGLASITIPSSVTSIGRYAFYSCSGLTSLSIPNSVTTIGEGAFAFCGKLASLSIPNSVTSIGRGAFNETAWYKNQPNGLIYINNIAYGYKGTMPANTTIEIKDGTISISSNAFINCSGLTSVGIPNSVTYIGEAAFEGCGGLTSLAIPNKVTSISNYVFRRCSGLTSVTLPNSLTSIGEQAFYGCSGLTSLTIPHSVTSIGELAFYGCNGLTSLTIPDGVTSIGENAFFGCSGLTSVTIPNSVTSIDDGAFENCGALTSLFSKIEKPFRFSTYAFRNISSSCTLTVPDGTKDAYIAAGWTEDVFMGGIVEAPYDIAENNHLSIVNAEAYIGRAFTMPVVMENTEDITAFQFEVSLPNGITLSKCELTERKGDHTVSFSKLANGNYQVTALSLSSEAFRGTEGALVNLTLNVDGEMETGEYAVSINNIELTTTGAVGINPADVTATLTVSDVLVADTNGDGKVSITDAVAIVNYILGNASANFVSAAADVNGDGKISITDAVAIVNMILNQGSGKANRREVTVVELDPQ